MMMAVAQQVKKDGGKMNECGVVDKSYQLLNPDVIKII